MNGKTFGYVALGAAAFFGFTGVSVWSLGIGGLFFFISGCCILFWWYSTTQAGQAFLKEYDRLNEERRKQHERLRAESNKITPQYVSQLFDELQANPSDRNLCDEIVRLLQIANPFILSKERTKEVYDQALEVLEANPDIIYLRQFCLHIGRWYCGRNRVDGKVTVYDEQAIQNDISVRAK